MSRAVINKDGNPVVLTAEEELEAIRSAVLTSLAPDRVAPESSLHSVLETVQILLQRYDSMAKCVQGIEQATAKCVYVGWRPK